MARDICERIRDNGLESLDVKIFALEEFICLLDKFGLHKKILLSNIPDEYDNFFKGGEKMYILNACSASFKVVNDLQDAFKRASNSINLDKNDDKFIFDNRLGRLGISLRTKKWNPGFFAGIIVDPRDHGLDKAQKYVKAGSEQIQPLYFCIVISVDSEYWHKKEKESYKEFKKCVEDAFIEDGYTPYTPNNKWHPIILYKKLDDMAYAIEKEIPLEGGLSHLTENIYKKILEANKLDTLNNALDVLEERYKQQQKKDA